jgi:hypothetical protein
MCYGRFPICIHCSSLQEWKLEMFYCIYCCPGELSGKVALIFSVDAVSCSIPNDSTMLKKLENLEGIGYKVSYRTACTVLYDWVLPHIRLNIRAFPHSSYMNFFVYFWRARVCGPLTLCLCRPFSIFERCHGFDPRELPILFLPKHAGALPT